MSGKSIGMLRRRLALEVVARAPDGAGGVIESGSELARLWADVRPSNGSESFVGDRIAGTHAAEVTIRHRGDVAPGMRFRYGARIYEIVSVADPDDRRHRLVCGVEERDL